MNCARRDHCFGRPLADHHQMLTERPDLFIITIMPKIVDHEERRRAIAAAAMEAVADRGLDAVKLMDVARAAGVTTGAIAHYFPDKDAVLAAALDEVCRRLFAEMEPTGTTVTIASLAEVLPTTPEKQRDWRVWLAYWGQAPYSDTLRSIHAQYYADIEAALMDDLSGLADDPRRTAAAIIAAVDGIGTRVLMEPDAWPADRQRALLDTLVGPLLTLKEPTP